MLEPPELPQLYSKVYCASRSHSPHQTMADSPWWMPAPPPLHHPLTPWGLSSGITSEHLPWSKMSGILLGSRSGSSEIRVTAGSPKLF